MKVYFAGQEGMDFAFILNNVSGIRYALFSVFPYIAESFGIKPMKLKSHIPSIAKYLTSINKGVIMDSGLFTLMFGAHKGKRDEGFVSAWQEALIDYVKTQSYSGVVVEVDCQKILGVESAWRLRREMKDKLGNQIMNVFHFEDGHDGLDRMIEFSDYIALSVPEIRTKKMKHMDYYVASKASYIKNKKPNIKIHLLGCTQQNILRKASFCDSCDSTSWQQVNRYGTGKILKDYKQVQISRKEIEKQVSSMSGKIELLFEENNIPRTGQNCIYYANYAVMAMYLKMHYERLAGDQN